MIVEMTDSEVFLRKLEHFTLGAVFRCSLERKVKDGTQGD
jgi:hypothetical protein